MKKSASLFIGILLGLVLIPSSAHAQQDTLYEEFLKLLNEQQNTPSQTNEINITEPAPSEPIKAISEVQAPVKTGQYSLSGILTRDENGRYFITTDEKPPRVLRVYGQKTAKEIMHAVVYLKVQLIGEKAFYNGKEVGISVQKVVPLTSSAVKTATPAKKMSVAKAPLNDWNMGTYSGKIIVNEKGQLFLQRVDEKGNVMKMVGRPMEYRLVNSVNWKAPYAFVGKGIARVNGSINDKRWVIRYNDVNGVTY